jgi:hypothetical protein
VINRQFRTEWQGTHGDSQLGTRPKRGLPLWTAQMDCRNRGRRNSLEQSSLEQSSLDQSSLDQGQTEQATLTAPRRNVTSVQLLRHSLLLLLLITLAGCISTARQQRPSYSEPTTVSARSIFAQGQLAPDIEAQHLAAARTAPALLRRSWLELQLKQPQAALDTSAQVLYAAGKPSANDESFARYLRAEAFRLMGTEGRGNYDRNRARELALDPELQRRLLPAVLPTQSHGPAWGRVAVEPRSSWRPMPPNGRNLDRMQRPRRVTIHHSAVYIRDTRPRAAATQIGKIQRDHMLGREYGDIGYHFLIDPSGRIWEGRELRYQGAHASGNNNIGNIGICLLGNFMRQHKDGQGPTNAQVQSMEQLVVQMMRHYRFGGDALFCHSDFKNTACPGPRMQPIVKQFARQLQTRLAGRSPRVAGTGALLAEEEEEEEEE